MQSQPPLPTAVFPAYLDNSYCGIYMIDTNGTSEEACTSPNPTNRPSPDTEVSVKIGFSRKMANRLDGYLLGSPVCLRVYGMIVLKRNPKVKKIMKLCEAYAHELLRGHHLVVRQDRCHSHTLEWFRCDIRKLCEVFVKCSLFVQEKGGSANILNQGTSCCMFSAVPHVHMYQKSSFDSCPLTAIRDTPKKADSTITKSIEKKSIAVTDTVNKILSMNTDNRKDGGRRRRRGKKRRDVVEHTPDKTSRTLKY